MTAEGNTDYGLIVSIGSIIASLAAGISVLKFWTKFTDRITRAEAAATDALQDAAEAKNENANLRDTIADMSREVDELIDKRSREQGEGLVAIRQHVTDLAFFVRDNFVKQSEFASAMKDIKDSQSRMEKKIDEVRERLPRGHS